MAWYGSGADKWKYRKKITVDHTKIGADVANFMTIVKITTSEWPDLAQAQHNGGDILFTSSDGTTKLVHRRAYFDGTTLIARVQVTHDVDADQNVYIYCGCATCVDQEGVSPYDANTVCAQTMDNAWIPYASNPVLPCDAGEGKCWGSVWKEGSTYHFYYTYVSNSGATNRIHHATSADGKSWGNGEEVLPVGSAGAWDDYNVWLPCVWKEGSTWYMIYAGTDDASGTHKAAGLATSDDGVTWTKYGSNPVLQGTAGQWDANFVEPSQVIKIGSTYYLWYSTLGPSPRNVGLATSTDLMTWSKDANNPIFTGDNYYCPCVFKVGSTYYMHITHDDGNVGDHGYLEMFSDAAGTFLSANRTFLGVIRPTGKSPATSCRIDTPFVLTDTISRDTYTASNGEYWCYFNFYQGTGATGEGETWLLVARNTPQALRGVWRDEKGTHHVVSGNGTGANRPVFTDSAKVSEGIDLQSSTGDFISMPDSNDFSFGNGTTDSAFSISVIVKFDALAATTYYGIVGKYGATGGYEWLLHIYNKRLVMRCYDESLGSCYIGRTYAADLATGTWYHIVATYSGSSLSSGVKLYLDGTQVDNADSKSGSYVAMEAGAADVEIGSFAGGAYNLDGIIDEVEIHNVERASTWVTTSYNSKMKPLVGEAGGLWGNSTAERWFFFNGVEAPAAILGIPSANIASVNGVGV